MRLARKRPVKPVSKVWVSQRIVTAEEEKFYRENHTVLATYHTWIASSKRKQPSDSSWKRWRPHLCIYSRLVVAVLYPSWASFVLLCRVRQALSALMVWRVLRRCKGDRRAVNIDCLMSKRGSNPHPRRNGRSSVISFLGVFSPPARYSVQTNSTDTVRSGKNDLGKRYERRLEVALNISWIPSINHLFSWACLAETTWTPLTLRADKVATWPIPEHVTPKSRFSDCPQLLWEEAREVSLYAWGTYNWANMVLTRALRRASPLYQFSKHDPAIYTPAATTPSIKPNKNCRGRHSSAITTEATALPPVNPRWLSTTKRRIGKCLTFGLRPDQITEAGEISQQLARDWRELVAGSEGFLTSEARRGMFRHNVVWGEMVCARCPLAGWWLMPFIYIYTFCFDSCFEFFFSFQGLTLYCHDRMLWWVRTSETRLWMVLSWK